MLDPFRMVTVNLVSSLLLSLGVLFYVYVYPKKKVSFFFFLLLISLLPLLSILRKGTYESSTLSENIYITQSFFETLMDGNFIPIWNAHGYAGYGVPQH